MKRKALLYAFVIILFLTKTADLSAQDSGAYLIPRQIYVGDPAIFVLPLPAAAQNYNDFILTAKSLDADFLPQDPNIDFHKITLERRTTGSRLVIEFTAFATGILEFPAIEIGGEYFEGLSILVHSLIDGNSTPVLSISASSLAMPGTAVMLYASMAIIVFLILFIIWFVVKGRIILRELRKKLKRRRLFVSIKKTEKRLQKAIIKGTDKRLILDIISDEFKNFLSVLTNNNCRAMTAREFANQFELLPPEYSIAQKNNSAFLGKFFGKCDEMRFSGINIDSKDIILLLDDMRYFIVELENAFKLHLHGKKRQKEEKIS
jgi:hypothetical protein